jgi:hypothetical protein
VLAPRRPPRHDALPHVRSATETVLASVGKLGRSASGSCNSRPGSGIMSRPWHDVSRRERCTVCDRPDWCSRSTNGAIAICRRQGGGGATQRTDKNSATFWLHRTGSSPFRPPVRPASSIQDTKTDSGGCCDACPGLSRPASSALTEPSASEESQGPRPRRRAHPAGDHDVIIIDSFGSASVGVSEEVSRMAQKEMPALRSAGTTRCARLREKTGNVARIAISERIVPWMGLKRQS